MRLPAAQLDVGVAASAEAAWEVPDKCYQEPDQRHGLRGRELQTQCVHAPGSSRTVDLRSQICLSACDLASHANEEASCHAHVASLMTSLPKPWLRSVGSAPILRCQHRSFAELSFPRQGQASSALVHAQDAR